MFVDELQISVRAGKGGDGCVSFLRDKNAQRGGPDGGDGGDGGSIILQPSTHVNTLYHLTGYGLFAAKNGEPGGSKDCYGKKAGDLVLEVPVGTVVIDTEHRLQRRERIPRDLWPRPRQGGKERRLAGIGQAEQSDIGDELEAQQHVALLA